MCFAEQLSLFQGLLYRARHFLFIISFLGMKLMSIYHEECIKLWKYYLHISQLEYYSAIFPLPVVVS
jgi:hypothetical protein